MLTPKLLRDAVSPGEQTENFLKWAEQFSEPSALREHRNNETGIVDPCCRTAAFQLQTFAEMADARNGIPSVIKSACNFLQFGPRCPIYLCEAVQFRMELNYSLMCAVIIRLLSYCKEVTDKSMVTPISVGILALSTEEQRQSWRASFNGAGVNWIFDPVYYRPCIGFLSDSSVLSVWNYGQWLTFSGGDLVGDKNSIIAWRFDINRDISFDGVRISKTMGGEWISLFSQPINIFNAINEPKFTYFPTIFISVDDTKRNAAVSTAISLRQAFSNAIRIVAVQNYTGTDHLPDQVFDDTSVVPIRTETTAEGYFSAIHQMLEIYPKSIYLPHNEIEVRLLSELIMNDNSDLCRRIVIPPKTSIDQIAQPEMRMVQRHTPYFRVPTFFEQAWDESGKEFVNRAKPFVNTRSFPVFVKSLHGGAIAAQNFSDIRMAVEQFQPNGRVHIQEAKLGFEEAIGFAAFEGELLPTKESALLMRRRGNTWAAAIGTPPDVLIGQLAATVAELNWTGGGVIKYIRTLDDQKYMVDLNPCFPFWVGGAAEEAVVNLPAALVTKAFQELFSIQLPCNQMKLAANIQPATCQGPEHLAFDIFGRPSRYTGIPSITASSSQPRLDHPDIVRLLQEYQERKTHTNGLKTDSIAEVKPSPECINILPHPAEILNIQGGTPYRHLNRCVLRRLMTDFKELVESITEKATAGNLKSVIAISIKTQPDQVVLKEALGCGYMAEAISMGEFELALKSGFKPQEIVMNGPAKFWLRSDVNRGETVIQNLKCDDFRFRAVFADSLTELEEWTPKLLSTEGVIGVRLALPSTASRYGVDISDEKVLRGLLNWLRQLPPGTRTGFHCHCASRYVGLKTWFNLCRAFVSACRSILDMAGPTCESSMTTLDFGGGFGRVTGDLRPQFETGLSDLFSYVRSQLPRVQNVILEPGKSVIGSASTLITRIIEIREAVLRQNPVGSCKTKSRSTPHETPRTVVVDASVADVFPNIIHYRHTYVLSATERANFVPIDEDGQDLVVGRALMENDTLFSGVRLPKNLKGGDYIVLTNAGAYETSLTFPFAEGRHDSTVIPGYEDYNNITT